MLRLIVIKQNILLKFSQLFTLALPFLQVFVTFHGCELFAISTEADNTKILTAAVTTQSLFESNKGGVSAAAELAAAAETYLANPHPESQETFSTKLEQFTDTLNKLKSTPPGTLGSSTSMSISSPATSPGFSLPQIPGSSPSPSVQSNTTPSLPPLGNPSSSVTPNTPTTSSAFSIPPLPSLNSSLATPPSATSSPWGASSTPPSGITPSSTGTIPAPSPWGSSTTPPLIPSTSPAPTSPGTTATISPSPWGSSTTPPSTLTTPSASSTPIAPGSAISPSSSSTPSTPMSMLAALPPLNNKPKPLNPD